MRRTLLLIAIGTVLLPASLRAADYCDDKIELGESPDGKAMMMMGALTSLALAERYCGAAPMSLSQILVVVEESHGCGPRAQLEIEIEERMKDGGAMTTDALIREVIVGDEKNVSQAEVDRRAKIGIEEELGGCDELLKIHQDFQQRYRNPPKWPPDPGQ